MLKTKYSWTEKKINTRKKEIKHELDEIENERGSDYRVEFIAKKIKSLEDSAFESNAQLDLFIYIVSYLVAHSKKSFLSQSQVKKAITMATTVLKINGVFEKKSRLSFLYGELNTILSQIQRKEGLHWMAACSQFLASHSVRDNPTGGEGFQILSMANRSLRLGHAGRALTSFMACEPMLSGVLLEKSIIGQIQSLRLIGKVQESRDKAELWFSKAGSEHNFSVSSNMVQELKWELLLHDFLETKDMSAMLESVFKVRDHYQISYITELSLWAMSLQTKKWIPNIPSLSNLKRNKALGIQKNDSFYTSAKVLQANYSPELPLMQRIQKLGEVLSQKDYLLNIEKELLILAASTRWLIRSKCHEFAKLTYDEYSKKSLYLSDGRINDIFGLLEDIKFA